MRKRGRNEQTSENGKLEGAIESIKSSFVFPGNIWCFLLTQKEIMHQLRFALQKELKNTAGVWRLSEI